MNLVDTPLRPSQVRRPLYALASLDEFIPFAVLFTLWFDDNGVSVAQISAALVV